MRLQDIAAEPFPHLVASQVYPDRVAKQLLAWLREHAPWYRHDSSFFSQYECELTADLLPAECAYAVSPEFYARLRDVIGDGFGQDVEPRVAVHAHKLVAGQGIGVHTDAPSEGGGTHRFVVTLADQYADEQGGHLVLLGSPDPKDIKRIFRPLLNFGVGFAMSTSSYHAVGDVVTGERYSVVYSCWTSESLTV